MSAVIVIDDALRERIAAEIAAMAREHPTSIAGEIVPEHFENIVDTVGERIDIEAANGDFEVALIVCLANIRHKQYWKFRKQRRLFPKPEVADALLAGTLK